MGGEGWEVIEEGWRVIPLFFLTCIFLFIYFIYFYLFILFYFIVSWNYSNLTFLFFCYLFYLFSFLTEFDNKLFLCFFINNNFFIRKTLILILISSLFPQLPIFCHVRIQDKFFHIFISILFYFCSFTLLLNLILCFFFLKTFIYDN